MSRTTPGTVKRAASGSRTSSGRVAGASRPSGHGWRTHLLTEADEVVRPLHGREWLIANGTGAYAMGTAAAVNMRRYHGLLVAATRPPVGRIVALNQVLEQLVLHKDGAKQTLDLSALGFRTAEGDMVLNPQGRSLLVKFERGLGVAWTYQWGRIELTRTLELHWQQQAATLHYQVRGLDEATADRAVLRLAPMLTLRDFHDLMSEAKPQMFDVRTDAATRAVTVRRGERAVTLHGEDARFKPGDDWWYDIYYAFDAERGQGEREHHFLPGWFELDLESNGQAEAALTVTLGDGLLAPAASASQQTREKHLAPIVERLALPIADSAWHDEATLLRRALAIAADDFVVARTIAGEKLATIMAGYPWFSDWGRDTFIALPGLLLVTGRYDEARAVLRTFAAAIADGLVPNRFDDYQDQAAHHNTVDASLWFIQAAMQYRQATGDDAAWDGFLEAAVRSIIDAYLKGTRFDIRMAGDGLVEAGNPDTQLTWMDAACDDPGSGKRTVFTPRHGKAVEINALWYAALAGMAELLKKSDKAAAAHYNKLTARIRRSFARMFWNSEAKCLDDHVWTDADGVEHRDSSLRPNQILAASLPFSPLPRTRQQEVVTAVRDHLLTPFGLRTLPATDAQYHGRYLGPQFDRDGAYHRGTAWPWLIGPYAEAVLRVGRFSDAARTEARAAVTPLVHMLLGRGPHPALGQLYEIHEADDPHRPVGCMAQAWSVAEVLRVMYLIESR